LAKTVVDCKDFLLQSRPFAKAMRVTRYMALPQPDEQVMKHANAITKLRDLMINKSWTAERADVAIETSKEIKGRSDLARNPTYSPAIDNGAGSTCHRRIAHRSGGPESGPASGRAKTGRNRQTSGNCRLSIPGDSRCRNRPDVLLWQNSGSNASSHDARSTSISAACFTSSRKACNLRGYPGHTLCSTTLCAARRASSCEPRRTRPNPGKTRDFWWSQTCSGTSDDHTSSRTARCICTPSNASRTANATTE
jgi:hypothetical protein